jgi:hypothetical protein
MTDRECECYRCLTERDAKDAAGWPITMTRMILCPTCGCKRCPHATDHRFKCTDSNDSGQPGSRYTAAATMAQTKETP